MTSALCDCNSDCPYSEESSIELSTTKEILEIESSICSVTTVHAAPKYTTITVASTYTSSCPSPSLEEITALGTTTCICNPDVTTTHQISTCKASSKPNFGCSTATVTKTVFLTSTQSSFSCEDTTTLLVTTLTASVADLGYVETREGRRF